MAPWSESVSQSSQSVCYLLLTATLLNKAVRAPAGDCEALAQAQYPKWIGILQNCCAGLEIVDRYLGRFTDIWLKFSKF